jgi:hypothetical protein
MPDPPESMNRVVTAVFSIVEPWPEAQWVRSVSSSKLGTALDLTADDENVYRKSDVQSHGFLLVTPTSVMMTIVVTATMKRSRPTHCRHWRHGMADDYGRAGQVRVA